MGWGETIFFKNKWCMSVIVYPNGGRGEGINDSTTVGGGGHPSKSHQKKYEVINVQPLSGVGVIGSNWNSKTTI